MQNVTLGHDSAFRPCVSIVSGLDQPEPSNVWAAPNESTSTQNVGVAHETPLGLP